MNEIVLKNGFISKSSGVVTGSLTIVAAAGETAFNANIDTFDLSGSLNVTGSSGFAGTMIVSGAMIITSASTGILPSRGTDVILFVSGNTLGTSRAVFGGDVITSSSLLVKNAAGTTVISNLSTGIISGSSDLQMGGNITGSNALLTGDLAVNGGDITTTATTFNLVTGSVTTLNVGGAARTIRLGAAGVIINMSGTLDLTGSSATPVLLRAVSGTIDINNDGRLRFGNLQTLTMFHDGSSFSMNNTVGSIGVTNNAVNQRIDLTLSSSAAAGVFRVRRAYGPSGGNPIDNLLEVRSDGAVLIGSGTSGVGLSSTTVNNDLFLNTGIVAVSGDAVSIQLVSSGNVTIKLDANNNGPNHFFAVQDYLGSNRLLVNENGNVDVNSTLTVSGTSILTPTTTTFNLLNTTLTGTLNIGGATTTINFGSPTTTGSIQGDLIVGNRTSLGGVIEKMFHTQSAGGGVTSFNMISQSIFYVNAPVSNITANFTSVPTTNDRIITPTVILSQSTTPRIVSAVQIDGAGQTINWSTGITPTGTAGKQDVFGFSLIRSGSAWKVLGQMSSYG